MKTLNLIFSSLVALSAHSALASSDPMYSREVVLPVDISAAKMKLSRAGYSVPTVKVLVPELAEVTLMNHRNDGEGAPCLATRDAWDPKEVIQGRPAVESVKFRISLSKIVSPNQERGVCEVQLVENVTANIRGFNFAHSRSQQMPDRHLDDCK